MTSAGQQAVRASRQWTQQAVGPEVSTHNNYATQRFEQRRLECQRSLETPKFETNTGKRDVW
jgi:hypothetical protein